MKAPPLLAATVATLTLIVPMAASAQSGPVFEAGYAEAFDISGGELGVGWRFSSKNFHLTPVVGGFIYKGDNDRYYLDQMSDGQTRCRDNRTGYFAKTELCNDIEVSAYARLEATASYKNLEGGVGYRFSDIENVVYGTASLKLSDGVAVKANVGQDYFGIGIALRR